MYYTDEDIDKLIQPIIDRQEAVVTWIIVKIAERIKEIGELLPSDVGTLEQLAKTSADVRAINTQLAKLAKVQVSQIKKVIQEAAENAYTNAKPFYDYRKQPHILYKENKSVQRVVKAIEQQTSGTYKNIAKAQAFMVRDPKNPTILKPTPVAMVYQNTVDKAIQVSKSGIDYNTAMRDTVNQLVNSGMKTVVYNPESGKTYVQSVDVAVRRNVLDGIRAVNQGVQNEVGKEFGADGVEITVHACPAPDHQYVQGHQFSMKEYAKIAPVPSIQKDGSIDTSVYEPTDDKVFDVNGNAYDTFKRRIGTCNCKHFAYNIIIGHAPQNYTDEQLKDILKENQKGIKVDGKHYTKYEAQQMQRSLERNIRKAKMGQIAFKDSGDIDTALKYQDKVTKYTKEYQAFSDKAGLRMKLDRIRVEGYKKIKK